MVAYRRLKQFFLFFILAYPLGTVIDYVVRRDNEFFPIFTWNLFATIPNTQTEFAIRVLAKEGSSETELAPYYLEKERPISSSEWRILRNLGRAVIANSSEKVVAEERARIERSLLLPNKVTKYALVERQFDVKARYENGAFKSERVLAEFSVADSP